MFNRSDNVLRLVLWFIIGNLAVHNQRSEDHLIWKIRPFAKFLKPQGLDITILWVAKPVASFVVRILRQWPVMVLVRKFFVLLDERVTDSLAGSFEPVDGQEGVGVFDEPADVNLDGTVVTSVVEQGFVGKFVLSFFWGLVGVGSHSWCILLCCGVDVVCRCWEVALAGTLLMFWYLHTRLGCSCFQCLVALDVVCSYLFIVKL